MDKAKIIEALKVKNTKGLVAAADHINTLSDGATPFWLGNLRTSKHVNVRSWDVVEAVTGNSDVRPYLAYQYFGNFRHRGNRLDTYESFSTGAADGSGSGEKKQYQRGYNNLKDSTSESKAKWYERVINDESMMNQVKSVYRNAFKA